MKNIRTEIILLLLLFLYSSLSVAQQWATDDVNYRFTTKHVTDSLKHEIVVDFLVSKLNEPLRSRNDALPIEAIEKIKNNDVLPNGDILPDFIEKASVINCKNYSISYFCDNQLNIVREENDTTFIATFSLKYLVTKNIDYGELTNRLEILLNTSQPDDLQLIGLIDSILYFNSFILFSENGIEIAPIDASLQTKITNAVNLLVKNRTSIEKYIEFFNKIEGVEYEYNISFPYLKVFVILYIQNNTDFSEEYDSLFCYEIIKIAIEELKTAKAYKETFFTLSYICDVLENIVIKFEGRSEQEIFIQLLKIYNEIIFEFQVIEDLSSYSSLFEKAIKRNEYYNR